MIPSRRNSSQKTVWEAACAGSRRRAGWPERSEVGPEVEVGCEGRQCHASRSWAILGNEDFILKKKKGSHRRVLSRKLARPDLHI